VLILGQGPIGLMFTMLVRRTGARVAATDTIAERLALAAGAARNSPWDPRTGGRSRGGQAADGRPGADLVVVAASAPGIVEQAIACSRPGARILLFAQTSTVERIEASGADICVGNVHFRVL
jgi:L-iditol 2-dehydrogenase